MGASKGDVSRSFDKLHRSFRTDFIEVVISEKARDLKVAPTNRVALVVAVTFRSRVLL